MNNKDAKHKYVFCYLKRYTLFLLLLWTQRNFPLSLSNAYCKVWGSGCRKCRKWNDVSLLPQIPSTFLCLGLYWATELDFNGNFHMVKKAMKRENNIKTDSVN
jgi:hypothetical protein